MTGTLILGLLPVIQSILPLAAGYPEYHYHRPFLQPLPVWDYWPWLILPLGIGVSIVYKSLKCRYMRQVPKEAAILSLWILLGMASAAAVLMLVVKFAERAQS